MTMPQASVTFVPLFLCLRLCLVPFSSKKKRNTDKRHYIILAMHPLCFIKNADRTLSRSPPAC